MSGLPAVPLAILSTGLVTPVGLSAPASCAAFRAKLTNPSETRFMGRNGEWIMAHQVPLAKPWRGLTKLAKMAALAISECLADIPAEEWQHIPLLLCLAENERPGRLNGLDTELFAQIETELQARFSPLSGLIPHGRISVAVALQQARKLIADKGVSQVLIAATDSLLVGPTLAAYDEQERLLNNTNSNGFMPGEGAGALLLGYPNSKNQLVCTGVGFGMETAHINSEEPLRAAGLTQAIKAALADAQCEMHDLDFRITDISGEQYYFKEAALALSRTLRQRKVEFDIWHPAECTGEPGAMAGIATIALADAACCKAYTAGHHILTHFANDEGQRAAAILKYGDL